MSPRMSQPKIKAPADENPQWQEFKPAVFCQGMRLLIASTRLKTKVFVMWLNSHIVTYLRFQTVLISRLMRQQSRMLRKAGAHSSLGESFQVAVAMPFRQHMQRRCSNNSLSPGSLAAFSRYLAQNRNSRVRGNRWPEYQRQKFSFRFM